MRILLRSLGFVAGGIAIGLLPALYLFLQSQGKHGVAARELHTTALVALGVGIVVGGIVGLAVAGYYVVRKNQQMVAEQDLSD